MAEATQTRPATGTFCWHELIAQDVAPVRTFYTELLGWTYEEKDMGEMGPYTILKDGDTMMAGIMKLSGECAQSVPPHWLSYIAVDDVDSAVKKAEGLGGKTTVPPTDIPDVGRFAIITDPGGASIALFTGS